MRISIHIDDATEEDVRRLFGTELRAVYAANIEDEPEVVEVEPEVVEAAEPVVEPAEPGDLVAKLTAEGRKVAKTVTLANNVTAKVEDMVATKDGEIGIIAGCFRGVAVVEFEDGRQEQFFGKDLTAYGEPEPAQPEPDVLGEVAKPNGKDVVITAEDLMAAARKVLAAKGAAKTQEIVIASGGGAKKVSEVPPEMYQAVHAALVAAVK